MAEGAKRDGEKRCAAEQVRMDRSEGERRAAKRPGDQPETEGSRTGREACKA